jgi:pimeloyl-ACP methyl ester carboxylesterase
MTAAQERLPIQVETFEWSHGYGRILADEIAHAYAHAAGERLSATVVAFHEAHPQIAISLIGHSAGSSVILTAAESLPPDILAHIVLLAPSVSADHDLRPALRTARAGIDVYYSRRDWWYLWLSVKVIGTADGLNRTAAGNSGFRPIINGPDDAALYCKLRQHPWDPSIEWTGNHGGHYGTYRQEYLRAYVLPILTPKQFEAR